jgi:hypothetical protein
MKADTPAGAGHQNGVREIVRGGHSASMPRVSERPEVSRSSLCGYSAFG